MNRSKIPFYQRHQKSLDKIRNILEILSTAGTSRLVKEKDKEK
jgi:hypothetical protein